MHLRDFMERLSRAVNVGAIISQDVPFGREYSWLWFTRRQVSESIIRFPQLNPLAGPERPFVKSQLLSTINVSDPSLFKGSGNPKSSIQRERSFGFAAVGVMGIVSGRPV